MDLQGRELILGQKTYWDEVRGSGGFDLEGSPVPRGATGLLMPFDTERQDAKYPYPVLVKRYARFGLHNYNMIHGSTLELHHLKKFNMTTNFQATYYLTLDAFDPQHTLTLQIGVARDTCSLNVRCFVARPKGHPSEPEPVLLDHNFKEVDHFRFPYWPSDFNDSQRFYMVNESVFQENNNWIRLVLELVLCTNDRGTEESDLSQLQIIKVAKETIIDTEGTVEYFYITFKGFALALVGELGEQVERKVIVRSAINQIHDSHG